MCRTGENIYKRKDGRWEGRYMKGRKVDGAIHYGYVYGKTKKVVLTKMLPLKREALQSCENNGSYTGDVTSWLDIWLLQEVQSKVKDSTFASYYHKLQHYIIPALGNIPLNRSNSSDLETAIKNWQEYLAASTIRILVTLLWKALKSAVKAELIHTNAAEDIELPRIERKHISSLTKEEQRKIEHIALQDKQGLPTLLALHTGMRIGELAALRWSDIDWEDQLISIRQTYQRVHSPSKWYKADSWFN